MDRRHTARVVHSLREPLCLAVIILMVLTIILSVILHVGEHGAGTPGFERWWDSLWWVLLYYIGNPGKIIQYEPLTPVGHTVAILTGIVKLLLFAIVTGYIITIIKEWLRSHYLVECCRKIMIEFRRRKSRVFPFRVVRPYEPVTSLQARLGLDENDIIDVVRSSFRLRLRNLADGELRADHPNDRLVVELMPILNRVYGCCVNRQSKVTIVCPTAVSEAGMGNFAWYVAQLGGFNYVSREIRLAEDEDFSYYNYKDPTPVAGREKFLEDIKRLAPTRNHWTIIMIASVDDTPKCHFLYGADKNDKTYTSPNLTLHDTVTLDNMLKGIDGAFKPKGVVCEWSGRETGVHSLGRKAGKYSEALTLRLSYKTMLWHNERMVFAKMIAEQIANALSLTPNADWDKEEGLGYGYREQPDDVR